MHGSLLLSDHSVLNDLGAYCKLINSLWSSECFSIRREDPLATKEAISLSRGLVSAVVKQSPCWLSQLFKQWKGPGVLFTDKHLLLKAFPLDGARLPNWMSKSAFQLLLKNQTCGSEYIASLSKINEFFLSAYLLTQKATFPVCQGWSRRTIHNCHVHF